LEPSAPSEEAAAAASPGKPRRPRLKDFGLIPLVVLFILNAVDEFDRAVLAVALEDIREDFGLSDLTVGILLGIAVIAAGILYRKPGPITPEWEERVWGNLPRDPGPDDPDEDPPAAPAPA